MSLDTAAAQAARLRESVRNFVAEAKVSCCLAEVGEPELLDGQLLAVSKAILAIKCLYKLFC